jgi:hypothetical protein
MNREVYLTGLGSSTVKGLGVFVKDAFYRKILGCMDFSEQRFYDAGVLAKPPLGGLCPAPTPLS